jgi:hypothetical protein
MNTVFHYVRDEKNHPTAVFVADEVEGHVRIGYSACHIGKDSFSRELGKRIALGRAEKWEKELSITIPERIVVSFFMFLRKCIERKSFQGMEWPRWIIEGNPFDRGSSFRQLNIDSVFPRCFINKKITCKKENI